MTAVQDLIKLIPSDQRAEFEEFAESNPEASVDDFKEFLGNRLVKKEEFERCAPPKDKLMDPSAWDSIPVSGIKDISKRLKSDDTLFIEDKEGDFTLN